MSRADIIMLAQLALNAFLVGLVFHRDRRWRMDRKGFALVCESIASDEAKLAEQYVDDGRRRWHAGRACAYKTVSGVLQQKETEQ